MSNGHRKPITRTRQLLACTECRRRKLKCDHNEPCSSCIKRNDEVACTYERVARGAAGERERRKRAESRLKHLEGLVQQLAALQNGTSSSESNNQSVARGETQALTGAQASAPLASDDLAYAGSTHWSAMLEDIEELRMAIGPEDNEPASMASWFNAGDDIDVIFGGAPNMPYEQVLDLFLPSRRETDRLIAAYFRASSITAPFIHSGAFRKRYQDFWVDPRSAPPLWTSMLFSVCHIAETAVMVGTQTTQSRYSLAAAHCLASGRWHRPQLHAVESLLLFTQSKLFVRFDITSDYGMLMAAAVRLATSSGYHRDPSLFAVPPFEQEMRRRTWSLCLQLDLLISFALGLPSNVQFPTWDTHRPTSLLDCDLDESLVKLPPDRPDSELTPITFYNAKHKLMAVFEKILRHSLSTDPSSGSEVEVLNAELDASYHSLPEIFRPVPIKEAIFDSPSLIVTRLCVLFLYGKCRCVLHRKYAARGDVRSLTTCYESSSIVLRYYIDIFRDFQPGGQFESERWLNSTITWQDFLLAVTVLCLALFVTKQRQIQIAVDYVASVELLKESLAACEDVSSQSKSTQRVIRLINATIQHFGALDGVGFSRVTFNGSGDQTQQINNTNGFGEASDIVSQTWPQSTSTANSNGGVWNQINPNVALGIEDDSWAYLEQFINVPSTI